MENPIYYVERALWLLERGSADENTIRRAGELMGMPTKRVDALRARYSEVFSRFVEKRCSDAGSQYRVCIYSWNRKRAFKAFPVSMYATGTVILFKGGEPLEVMSNPMPKALDYSEALERTSPEVVPAYVSARVDGWQVNAYYDTLLKRWIFSTRYVLHNMYFTRGTLNIDPYGEISNPIVSLADTIASNQGLYDRLEGYRGWTFIFSLLGPEPAITSPPYPIAPDPSEYSLYLIAARRSDGRLISGAEASKEIGWNLYPEPVTPKKLRELYEDIKVSLDTRSIIAWIPGSLPQGDPLLVEIPSQYYYDTMMVKHLNDAKSALILCSEDLCDRVKGLASRDVAQAIDLVGRVYRAFLEVLQRQGSAAMAGELVKLVEVLGGRKGIDEGEVAGEIRSGNFRRLARKILALVLEGRSLASKELYEVLASVEDLISRYSQLTDKETPSPPGGSSLIRG